MLWKEAAKNELGTQRALTHFIKTNNPAGLALFLELGANVEARLPAFDLTHMDKHERFPDDDIEAQPIPLLIVVDLDHVPLARLLLEKGAKVHYVSCNDYSDCVFSPLHAAHSAEMVQLLLDHHADPDLDDGACRRPLHWAAIRDNLGVMQALVQHGANVNPDRHSMYQPLHEAVKHSLAAVRFLVDHGARVGERDLIDRTPLHVAAARGKTDVVKFLLEQRPEGARDIDRHERRTPLHYTCAAVWDCWIDTARVLVEIWPEGKAALDGNEKTPLSVFKKEHRHAHLSLDQRSEMIALLGGV
jgi:ankyrin repeat protein